MRRYLMPTLLLMPLVAPIARADFVVATAPASATDSRPGETSQRTDPAPPRFDLAQGFGDKVPLGFAVRQIVPPAVKVTYGPGADPDALVDWKGGQGWNRVLRAAVQPLGLRLVMTAMEVRIRK
jgi:hypothetical protein